MAGQLEEDIVEGRFADGQRFAGDGVGVQQADDLLDGRALVGNLHRQGSATVEQVGGGQSRQAGGGAVCVGGVRDADLNDSGAQARLELAGGALGDDPAAVDHHDVV